VGDEAENTPRVYPSRNQPIIYGGPVPDPDQARITVSDRNESLCGFLLRGRLTPAIYI
jgi:hypothetical protein